MGWGGNLDLQSSVWCQAQLEAWVQRNLPGAKLMRTDWDTKVTRTTWGQGSWPALRWGRGLGSLESTKNLVLENLLGATEAAWCHGSHLVPQELVEAKMAWGPEFEGAHWEAPGALVVGLVLGKAGTRVCSEAKCSLHSPLVEKLCLSTRGCLGLGEGRWG